MARHFYLRYTVRYKKALFKIAVALHHFDRRPRLVLREYLLFYLLRIFFNQRVGCVNYILSRPVVLLKFIYLQIRIRIFKCQYVSYVGSSERVNTLCVISDNRQIADTFCKQCYDLMLCEIRILILINKHVFEKFPIMVQYILIGAQKFMCVI